MDDCRESKNSIYLMSYYTRCFLWIGIVLLFSCRGGSSSSTSYLSVVEIINGNTLKTEDGKTIELLGISDNERTLAFLNENLLNEKITYKYDSEVRRSRDKLMLYVQTRTGLSINGEIIKRKLCDFEKKNVHDSLSIFTAYADGEVIAKVDNETESIERIPKKRTPTLPTARRNRNRDFKTVVRDTEKSVFLIVNRNSYGNEIGIGTGFFISRNGVAVSNYHVFEGGSSWYVRLLTGETMEVEVIYHASEKDDFIIFSVDIGFKETAPIPFYNEEIEKGEEVFVLGNPNGLESTLTRGVVSAIRKDFWDMDLIQIDAAISPGSSGSPVLTLSGEAIGVATLKKNDCENCNFAINIELIKEAIKNFE